MIVRKSLRNSLCNSCCGHTLYNEIQQHSGSGNIHLTPRLHGDNKRAIEAIIVVLCFDRSQTFLPILYETFFMLTTTNTVAMQNLMRLYRRNLCNIVTFVELRTKTEYCYYYSLIMSAPATVTAI